MVFKTKIQTYAICLNSVATWIFNGNSCCCPTVAWARKLNRAHGMQQLSNCYRLSLCCKYFIVYSHSNSPNSTVNIVLRWMVYNCMCKLYVYSTYSWGKSSGFSTKWEISFNLNSIIFNRFVYSQYGDSNALQQPTNQLNRPNKNNNCLCLTTWNIINHHFLRVGFCETDTIIICRDASESIFPRIIN